MSEVNFQFGLEYIAWAESKYHDVKAPSYQDWLEIELQSERFAHAETKKRLEESEAKIKYLLERETELESQLNELNIERLKPFVLKSEMENMKSIMQTMIDEHQERLEISNFAVLKLDQIVVSLSTRLRELEDAIDYYCFHLYGDKYYIEGFIELSSTIADHEKLVYEAIQNSRARKEAMGG